MKRRAFLGTMASATLVLAGKAEAQGGASELLVRKPSDAQVNQVIASLPGGDSLLGTLNDGFQNQQVFGPASSPVVVDFSNETNFSSRQLNVGTLRNTRLLDGVTFESSNLNDASLVFSSARRSNFYRASLGRTKLPTDVTGADFTGISLRRFAELTH